MKKGFLAFVFLIAFCLTACSTKMAPVEERLPLTESKAESTESSMSEGTVAVTESLENTELSKVAQSPVNLVQSIIQVQTETQLGSGILWEKQGEEWIVVTAAHVVEGLPEAEVYLVQEEKILSAKVMEVNGLDLAFLSVSTASLESSVEAKYHPVTTMSDSQEENDEVFAFGYNPYGELCEYAGTVIDGWIYVEDFDNYMLLCDCSAEAGMSGGAVVTEDGRLIGLVCGENEKGLLAVLPVGVIKSEYQLFHEN